MQDKKAFPKSEHHTSSYRTDLGYFLDKRGREYQLGVTDESFHKIHGYTCDYTIVGEEPGDYRSSDFRYAPLYENGIVPEHDEWRIELWRRAYKAGLISESGVIPMYIDFTGSVYHNPLRANYGTVEEFFNGLK